ncbi:MerR family transcriptional regulator [Streptomyces sp. NPDC088354]|uniref:MerR family transcriptional regulator n=1 Tax=unclassified Streptomyces TaxID=2593676 RepID=UPI0029B671ED|nr:MerR family transcriptional regulator [Streptomyces sp. MI02-7b]MDX3070954.1 MerR family transcriptional regulator [Streptomyces sp. MI02-7b]
MIGNDTTGLRWSIGELARAGGVTVRTLHHYDEIGLVRASERTASGHRRYTEGDLHRLYRVRALRTLGLSLEEIGDVVDGAPDDLPAMRAVLGAQLEELRRQGERIGRITQQVRGLLRQFDGESIPDPDQFMTTLEMISVLDGYFTQEQQDQLARRRAELGPQAVDAARTRWSGLVEELLAHVDAGTALDDPGVRRLVREWDELGSAFHTGGQGTEEAARRMWQDHGTDLGRGLPWSAERMAGLVGYLERARRAH